MMVFTGNANPELAQQVATHLGIALGRAGEKPWMKVSEVRRLLNLPHEEGTDDLQPVAGSSAAPQEASK